MNPPSEYTSFLVRLWSEPLTENDTVTVWRGEIVHIQSGERRTLLDLAALVAFLREQSGDANLLMAESRVR